MTQLGIPQETVQTSSRSFAALGVDAPLQRVLAHIGFRAPTLIQADTIPAALEGRDVIGLAETGSGKTAAFGLPLVQRLDLDRKPGAVILSPTREIALQTHSFLTALAEARDLRVVCLIGGVKIGPQTERLRRGANVVVATPGRLLDHLRRRNVRLDGASMLVIDEADRMFDLGFLPQIREVLDAMPGQRQTLLFSATLPPEIQRLVHRSMREPVTFDLRPEGGAARGITHRLYLVEPDDKKPCLLSLLQDMEGSTLVFLRRKMDAEWASRQLSRAGHPVARIHSDRSQGQRVRALEGFREGEHRILVATDIAARGLDIPHIEHIINFDMPATTEDYIHRAGRTARGALQGVVSTIATLLDKPMVRQIETALGVSLQRCVAPGVAPYVEAKKTRRGRKLIRRRLL